MTEIKNDICPVCNERFSSPPLGLEFLTTHDKVICIICSKIICESCAKNGKTKPPLPEKEGTICPECFQKHRTNITIDDFVANRLHETAIQIDTLVKGWLADADKRIENRLTDIQKSMQNSINQMANYLWMMLFFSIFVGFYGLFLFLLTQHSPAPNTLIVIFRLGLLVLVFIPWIIWFISSVFRAVRNRSLENHLQEIRNGKPLGVRDYLFGLFYFQNPVQNIWLPIAFLGTVLSLLLYIIIKVCL